MAEACRRGGHAGTPALGFVNLILDLTRIRVRSRSISVCYGQDAGSDLRVKRASQARLVSQFSSWQAWLIAGGKVRP
jgi:hypothetical protein